MVYRPGWCRFRQVSSTEFTCADCQDFCSDRLPASDIQRRVSDDDNFIATEPGVQYFFASFVSNAGDAIAVFVIVRKGSGREVMPQIVMTQFQFRSSSDIASEQPKHRFLRGALEFVDHGQNSFAHPAFA